MAGFEASNERGEQVGDLTPAVLDQLLADWTDITIRHSESGDRQWVQAAREPDAERWRVQVRTGNRKLVTHSPGRAATYDLLRSWAAADGWWQEAFAWSDADLP